MYYLIQWRSTVKRQSGSYPWNSVKVCDSYLDSVTYVNKLKKEWGKGFAFRIQKREDQSGKIILRA